MTDVSGLKALADLISKSSTRIRAYAQAQALATQAQEQEIRQLAKEIEMLKGSGPGTRPGPAEPPPSNPPPDFGTALPTRLPQSSGAVNYYVNPSTGSDGNSGTSAGNPFRTINKAISVVTTAGTIIHVADGTYTISPGFGNAAINISSKNISGAASNPITIKATNPGGVVINSATYGGSRCWAVIVDSSTGWRIEGIKISKLYGRDSLAGSDAVTIYDSTKIELDKCIFEDIGGMALLVKGESATPSADIWVHACTFRPTGTTSVTRVGSGTDLPSGSLDWTCSVDVVGSDGYFDTKGSHFIYAGQYTTGSTTLEGVDRFVIANSIFAGKTAGRHVQLGPQCRTAYVVNNAFYNNYIGTYRTVGGTASDDARYAGGAIEIFSDGNSTVGTQYVTVANNIFQRMSGHAVYGSGSVGLGDTNVVHHNLAYDINGGRFAGVSYQDDYTRAYEYNRAGSTLFTTPGGNLTNADPLFVSALASPSGNFRLQSGSPAIDAGDRTLTPATDITGATRTLNTLGPYA